MEKTALAPWLEYARLRKGLLTQMGRILPLVEPMERAMRVINRNCGIGVVLEQGKVVFTTRKEQDLTDAAFLAIIKALQEGVPIVYDYGTNTDVIRRFMARHPKSKLYLSEDVSTFTYAQLYEYANSDVLRTINDAREAAQASQRDIEIEVLGSRRRAEISTSTKLLSNTLTAQWLLHMFADCASSSIVELLGVTVDIGIAKIRRYVEITTRLSRLREQVESETDPELKQKLLDERISLSRELYNLVYEEERRLHQRQLNETVPLVRERHGYVPIYTNAETGWLECLDPAPVSRTILDDAQVAQRFPNLHRIVEAEIEQEMQTRKDVQDLLDLGVPEALVHDGIARGLDPTDILEIHLESDSRPAQRKSAAPRPKPEMPKQSLEASVTEITGAIITSRYGSVVPKSAHLAEIVEKTRKEIERFVREYVVYLSMPEGERGNFAQDGRLKSTAAFTEKFETSASQTEGWRIFAMQYANGRVVLAVRPRTSEMTLHGIYTNHEGYTYSVARFRASSIRGSVLIDASNAEVKFSVQTN